jgi:hypothetical protein
LVGNKAQESDPLKLQTILEDYRAAVVSLQTEIKAVRAQAQEQDRALRYLCCDMVNQDGATALMSVAYSGRPDMVNLMVHLGTRVDLQDNVRLLSFILFLCDTFGSVRMDIQLLCARLKLDTLNV